MYRCRRKLLNAEKMLQQTLLIHQLAMLRFNIILVLVLQIPYLKILASTEAKQSKMLIRMILGYAYPAFECFKTVEKNKVEIEDLRFWCRYWILVAIVTVLEKLLHMLVSWVPMYAEMKLALFIYLWYPKTKEASYYKYHVEELVNSAFPGNLNQAAFSTVVCSMLIVMGVERGICLEGMTEEQISKALEDLIKVGAALKS